MLKVEEKMMLGKRFHKNRYEFKLAVKDLKGLNRQLNNTTQECDRSSLALSIYTVSPHHSESMTRRDIPHYQDI